MGHLDELEDSILQLRDNPRLGRTRDGARKGYRALAANQHIVLHKITDNTIHIIRVLHAQMDPDRHL